MKKKAIFFVFQDEKASYDVNGHDPDPSPRYEYTNENRWVQGKNYTISDSHEISSLITRFL